MCCRFEQGSQYVRALGSYMKQQQTFDFQPYFVIESEDNLSGPQKVSISVSISMGESS